MKTLFVILFMSITALVHAQDNYYYNDGEKIYFAKVDNGRIYIRFQEGTSDSKKDEILVNNDLQNIHLSDRLYSSNDVTVSLMLSNIIDRKNELLKNNEVAYVSDFYRVLDTSEEFHFFGSISVGLKPKINLNRFYNLLRQNDLEIVRDDRFSTGMYLLEPIKSGIDVVSTANRLFETGLFNFSSPSRSRQLHMY